MNVQKMVVFSMITLLLAGIHSNVRALEETSAGAERITETVIAKTDLVRSESRERGGWWSSVFSIGMVPLWACSILLVTLIIERHNGLKKYKILDEEMIAGVVGSVGEGDIDAARKISLQSNTVIGRAWSQGLHEFLLGEVTLHEGLTSSTLLYLKPLKRNLQTIQTLGVITPLFGLLGTIIGMIMTFTQIAATGGADKAQLADGIGVALFTTAGGLIVAIPAIVANRYFTSRVMGYAEIAEGAIHKVNYRHSHVLASFKSPSEIVEKECDTCTT